MNTNIEIIDGRKILTFTNNGTTYQLGSMYFSDVYQHKWAASHISNYRKSHYLIFGLGDGSYVRSLIDVADEDSIFCIYEPDIELYETARNNFNLDFLSFSKVKLILNIDELLPYLLTNTGFYSLSGYVICVHPNYDVLFIHHFKEFRYKLDTLAFALNSSQDMYMRRGSLIVHNIINNLKIMQTGATIEDLKNLIPDNLPIIIVASGPSLNDNVEYLRAVKGRSIMIAVDSALPMLFYHQIIPDLFISVDSYKEKYNFADPRYRLVPGVFTSSSRDFIFDEYKAPAYFYNDGNEFSSGYYQLSDCTITGLMSGGSVGNQAFLLANYLGASEIILVGLDLAYKDGRTHSDNNYRSAETVTNYTGLLQVTANNGSTVYTDKSLNTYLEWLGQAVKLYPQTKVINTAEYGASIEGTEYMSFQDAAAKYCTQSIDINFKIVDKKMMDAVKFIELMKKQQKEFSVLINSTIDRLTLCEYCSNELIEACDLLLHTITHTPALNPIYLTACESTYDILKDIYLKENTCDIISKYIKYFKIIADACISVIEIEEDFLISQKP